ncbi:MAG: ribonuclease R [Gammaproteobacteria bacterium]|nr:ribonuclease R [Gammaproteobacteria bacterium]
MTKHPLPKTDPHAVREARKYERPIPSREFITQRLIERGVPQTFEQLAALLELHEDVDVEALRRRLNAMERDGQLIRNRRGGYIPVNTPELVRGRVIGHPDGYGFLVPDQGGDDLYLAPRQMRALLHDDRAVVRVTGVDRRGRREAALVEVLERNTHQVVGRFYLESGIGFVVPDNKRIPQQILVPTQHQGGAAHGQIVVAEIVEQPSAHSQPIGRVIEILGDHMAPGMEIDIAIRAHALPSHWPPAVQEETAQLGERVPSEAVQGRVDLRDVPLVTIDGQDARDFDDAVYCERKGKGWRLLVAIADVSWYVPPGGGLDEEARLRGNSVYFPDRVIPMLPEVLSNGLCSLNPAVDRLCMVCELYLDPQGKVTRSRFFEGVMCSAARLTYDEVAAMLIERERALRARYAHLVPHLEELYALYQALKTARERRGAIDFDTTETRIVFGSGRKIDRIVPVERNDAHRLIEECMVAANVAAARLLLKHKLPALFRVHGGPNPEKLADLRTFLGELGLRLAGGKEPEARHYAELLAKVLRRPDAHLIQTVLLRSLDQAVYSPDNIGHFGLAYDAYTHFTSPIRRYPDLLVHRAIRHILAKGEAEDFEYAREQALALGEHCSMTERRADEAVRDAVDWLKCEYMMDKVGEEFDGIIAGVTSFGIFVELDGIYVQGLVHVTALGDDYYHFDPAGHRLRGERSGRMYRLGDKVRVKVMRVDLDERKIDFELARPAARVGAAERKPAKRAKRSRR